MESSEAMIQQERLQAIAEKRKRQTEIENKRRQLEDDRRQLQYLKSKALREKWLLEGAPSSTSEEDEGLKKQMKEDEQRTKDLEEAVLRLEKELELLENGGSATSTKENLAEEAEREEKQAANNVQKTPLGSTKVVHEVRQSDGAVENGVQLLSLDEVEELIHKADEVTLSDVSLTVDMDEMGTPEGKAPSPRKTPRKEITGVEAKPVERTNGPEMATGKGGEPEQPVTMIFMGYQNVEDENETKKVLGLEGTVKAELVVIEDAENKAPSPEKIKKDSAPPNGKPTDLMAEPQKQENQAAEKPTANDKEPEGGGKEQDMKEKHPCKCCTVM